MSPAPGPPECPAAHGPTPLRAGKLRGPLDFGILSTVDTWWLIPLSEWVITPVIDGISRVNQLITGVIIHLLSGMSH